MLQQQPNLFHQGEYLPFAVAVAKAYHVIPFTRKFENTSVLVVVPRLVASLLNDIDLPPIGAQIWQDTHVLLPFCDGREECQNVFAAKIQELTKTDGPTKIGVTAALAEFPVALCVLSCL